MDISKLVNSEKKEMLKVLRSLISKNTTNPPGNEWKAAEVVRKFFEKENIKYEIIEKKEGRTNIVGYIGNGKPRFLIACHLDVVHPGYGWRTKPFRMEIKRGRAYGRGTNDDKGPMSSMLIAGKILKRFEKSLKGQVILACVADEEKGSKYGMYYLLRKKRLRAEYGIVPDIARNMKKIDIAEKGLLYLKITSFGKQVHGSRPHKGVNAIWNMIEFLNHVRKYKPRHRKHWLLSGPTVNLGSVRGGYVPNIVPGKCEALLDFRYIPGQKAEKIIDDVKKITSRVREKNRQARFKIEVMDRQEPIEVPKDSFLIQKIKRHTRSVTGKEPRLIGLSSTTVLKPLVLNGTVAVGFSPGENTAHMANEYISISQLLDYSKILCLVTLDILS